MTASDRIQPSSRRLSSASHDPALQRAGLDPAQRRQHAARIFLLPPPLSQRTSTKGFRLAKGSATRCGTVQTERGSEPSNASALTTPSVTYRKLELQRSLPQFKAGPRNHERR